MTNLKENRMTAIAASLDRSTFLRRALWVDAATCLATGALLATAASPLAPFLGLPDELLRYAGVALFPVAAFMGWLSLRREVPRWGAWLAVLGNAGWVAGSALVLFVLSPTALGYAFVVAQAAAVAALAELEYAGLRRITP
jgi:uncharacterized membrane protein